MKTTQFLQTTALATLLVPLGFGHAAADLIYGGNDVVRLSGHSDVYIEANNDDGGINENVYVTVAGQPQMTITETGTTINDSLSVLGGASVSSNLAVSGVISNPSGSNDGQLTIGDNLNVTGWSNLGGEVYITGDTRINNGSSLSVDRIVDAGGDNLVRIDDSLIISGPPSSTPGEGETAQNYSLQVDGYSDLDATNILGVATINTTGDASTTIGNSRAASVVTMTGGTSRVALGNGQTSINTTNGAANTSIGVAGNATSVLSTSIAIGNDTQSSMIMVGTGSASNSIAMGNDEIGTVISATAGNTSQVMMNNVIANTVEAGEGVAGGTVVGTNGASRFVADANGKLTEVTNADTTSGTTASMVVQNSAGNIHGLVVQETKTTLSGGINSASLTLDDRGATFSDPANGNPIQVHGVADGTAPFDAVNVRQLYSGLASVLAAAPDIRLEPGKTGFGIGVGSYGGYQAVGLGFGHMYDNGVVLTGSVARGAHSETAARASLSWTW